MTTRGNGPSRNPDEAVDKPRNRCGLWLGAGLTAGPCTEPEGHDNGKHDPEETQR